jgi:hypothetical protein
LEWSEGERIFVVAVEDRIEESLGITRAKDSPGIALVVRVSADLESAEVESMWRLRLQGEAHIGPYKGDGNRQLEGIAIDRGSTPPRVYVVYEQAEDGLPRLYTFEAPDTAGRPGSPPLPVSVEPMALDLGFEPKGKTGESLNFNGLTLRARPDRSPLLIVLCRNRELLLLLDLLDPQTAQVDRQVPLKLLSPSGEPIVWVSPEGIAADPERNKLYIINDPDPSCGGNWKLRPGAGQYESHERRRRAEASLFSQFVPLLFELEVTGILEPSAPPFGENLAIDFQ